MAAADSIATTAYLAQSAFAQSPASAGLDLSKEIIVCLPFRGIAEYQGTRAALEAEGIIPSDTKWPDGFGDLHWEDDKFKYWIRRLRPEGVKGPRKQFLGVDWWMLRCSPVNGMSRDAEAIELKAKALADEIYRQTPKYREECNKEWDAYSKARDDDKFQAFKSLIAGITRHKRGRRPNNAGTAANPNVCQD
jgi:hypothetical protein